MKGSAIVMAAFLVAVLGVASAHHDEPKQAPHRCMIPYFWNICQGRADRAGNMIYTVEYFKHLLGGRDNGHKRGPIRSGFRWINWDDHEIPFEVRRDFFSHTHGMTVDSKHDEFRCSNPYFGRNTHDKRFSSINHRESKNFITYTRKRLFTPVHENRFTIRWVIPGKRSKALVQGFGAVFVDVWREHTTKMIAYDIHGCVIAEQYVHPQEHGLSFLGFHFEHPIIAKIEIVLGNTPIDAHRSCGRRCGEDVVVMDDFYYSEPQYAF